MLIFDGKCQEYEDWLALISCCLDLFQTVFGSGENEIVVDAICNHLFGSNWDLYAEDEFGVDVELIYSPSPLDEVWLSEPEHWDSKEKMQSQNYWHKVHQCIRVCHTSAPMPPNSPPDVAAVLDDSSVDSSSHVEMSKSEKGI